MKRFYRTEDGFVLIFALLVLPVFIGFGLLIIDIGRGNNAHSDLAAAADSLALAGARELNGGTDAIPRAKSAMGLLTNNVSMLAKSGAEMEIELVYEDVSGNEFQVAFLDAIPALDTTPIDAAWLTSHTTMNSMDAQYVYVRAQSRNLDTAFLNPVNLLPFSVPVVASAVAMTTSAACDVPPIYICNPFEFIPGTNPPQYNRDYLQAQINAGELHGRLIRLHPSGNGTHGPGNFGFLDVVGSGGGANALNGYFAGEFNPSCYGTGTVTTKPGASNGVRQGINTRFDIYSGSYGGGNANAFLPVPAGNVRKGALPNVTLPNGNGNGNGQGNQLTIGDCVGTSANAAHIVDDHVMDLTTGVFNADGIDENAYGLPDNFTMLPVNQGIAGAAIGANDDWPMNTYLTENYGATSAANITNSLSSSFSGRPPSRYDVYGYELANPALLNARSPGDQLSGNTGELGRPDCGQTEMNPARAPDPAVKDRRVIVAAVIDCGSNPNINGREIMPVNSYVSMFMTRPMVQYSPSTDMTIDVEVIDITGYGGNGTLETYIREEAILVR